MINRKFFAATFLVAVLSLMAVMPAWADVNDSAVSGRYEKTVKASASRIFGDDDIIEEDEEHKITYYWQKIDDEWICSDRFGDPITGWAPRGEHMYYLNKQGQIKTGWIKDNGEWYYLYSEDDEVEDELIGTLAKSTWIDNYYVDKDGVQTKIKK